MAVSTTHAVLFVCLGNICRSPLAQGVLEDAVAKANVPVLVDSAGTSTYHIGEPPDSRGIRCAKGHGIDTSGQRARQVKRSDFADFDLVIAMDASNLDDMKSRWAKTDEERAKLRMLMDYVPDDERTDVPDCWYADDPEESFEDVYSVFVKAAPAILSDLGL